MIDPSGCITNRAIEQQVIREFGQQWTSFTENNGYYASLSILREHLGPLASVEDFQGKVIADIGSGTGRIVNMLGEAGARHIVAIEPSDAFLPLQKNTAKLQDRITYLHERGDEWSYPNLDYVVSIGVIHHIVDPIPTILNAFNNLKPGGHCIIWLYGYEGNELYLLLAQPIRKITPKLPHWLLNALSWMLVVPLSIYAMLCKIIRLPMHDYMRKHVGQLNMQTRFLTVYDQLNPTWAKYYRREEAEALLKEQGFTDVRSHHRSGYSWTVIGKKPDAKL